jgi:hypothetical protein
LLLDGTGGPCEVDGAGDDDEGVEDDDDGDDEYDDVVVVVVVVVVVGSEVACVPVGDFLLVFCFSFVRPDTAA